MVIIWLIDFGLAVSLPQDDVTNAMTNSRFPIVGCILTMAPQTIILNHIISDLKGQGQRVNSSLIHEINITEIIIEANLYSLQTVVLWCWPSSKSTSSIKHQLIGFARKINDVAVFHSNPEQVFSKDIGLFQEYLGLNQQLLELHNTSNGVLSAEMFELVASGSRDTIAKSI